MHTIGWYTEESKGNNILNALTEITSWSLRVFGSYIYLIIIILWRLIITSSALYS